MESYRELKVWQASMDLAEQVYEVTKGFPRREVYGLSSQMRRAAVSVPSNIAEGQAKGATRDYLRHLSIARGSLAEVETQTLLANRLGFLPEVAAIEQKADEIGRMLRGLQKALQAKLKGGDRR